MLKAQAPLPLLSGAFLAQHEVWCAQLLLQMLLLLLLLLLLSRLLHLLPLLLVHGVLWGLVSSDLQCLQAAGLLLLMLAGEEGSVHCQVSRVLLLLRGWDLLCWGCVGPEVPGTVSAACLE
jgi:hypothetical protein